jgi:hypothetical protein
VCVHMGVCECVCVLCFAFIEADLGLVTPLKRIIQSFKFNNYTKRDLK